MWTETALSRRLAIRWPIVQGPFGGGISTVPLVAAVSNGGGLGSFGAHGLTGEEIVRTVREIRAVTSAPFAINLWVPLEGNGHVAVDAAEAQRWLGPLAAFYRELRIAPPELSRGAGIDFNEQVQAILETAPPAFSFVFGIPAPDVLEACRRRGIVTLGTATHVAEAEALEAAGVDVIVASGLEAGGHRASFLRPVDESPSTMALVSQVVQTVRAPIVAAGGIADGRQIVAMLALGAAGVQVGTAFLACDESGASEAHKTMLGTVAARRTRLTRAFTGRPARGIVNRFVVEMERYEGALAPYPVQNALTQPIRAAAGRAGCAELLALWAGQNAPLVRRQPAADLLEFLVEDTHRVRAALAALNGAAY